MGGERETEQCLKDSDKKKKPERQTPRDRVINVEVAMERYVLSSKDRDKGTKQDSQQDRDRVIQ